MEVNDVKDGTKRAQESYVVLAASFLTLFFNTSLDYASGVFHVAILETYDNAEVGQTVWLGSLFFCMFGLSAPLASLIINLTDCRTCVFISGLLGLVGFSVNIFVTDVRWLFITYALIAGVGTSLAHTGALVVLGYHYGDKMNLACGVAVCGMASGLFVHPALCQYLIDNLGLPRTFLLAGAIAFNSCVCGMLMKPTDLEKQHRSKVFSGRSRRSTIFKIIFGFFSDYSRTLKNKSFMCFLICGLTFGMALSSQYLYLPDFLQKRGISGQVASFSVSMSGIGGVISRVLTGFAAQDSKIGSGLLFASLNGLMGVISLLIIVFTSSSFAVCVYGLLIGLYTGGTWALFNPITYEILGVERMATGYGVLMFACGFGFLIGPPIAGSVFLLLKSYYGVYVFSAAMFFSCTVCGFLTTIFQEKRDVPLKVGGHELKDIHDQTEAEVMVAPGNTT